MKPDKQFSSIGCYIEWSTDVDLGPPFEHQSVPPEDKHILDYYNALQYALYETGNTLTDPLVRNGGATRSSPQKDRVAITVFGSPTDCLGILLEGSRQCPGDVLLVLSKSWISKTISNLDESLYSLYVHKAITFSHGAQSFIELFDPPRRVTYFIDLFTHQCTDCSRYDGDELEVNMDCPMNITQSLSGLIDDKLWTRIKMAESNVKFPETLAFTYRNRRHYVTSTTIDKVIIVSFDNKTEIHDVMLSNIRRFLNAPFMRYHQQVVVKPSGGMTGGSLGVSFHARCDVIEIWNSAIALLPLLEPGDSILIETFYETVFKPGSKPSWMSDENNAVRFRSTVVRTCNNLARCVKVVCGVADRGAPVNGDNTVQQSMQTTLRQCGIADDTQRKQIELELRQASERLMQSIIDYDQYIDVKDRGSPNAQADIIGIDFIVTDVNGSIDAVGIEVNGPNCTTNCDVFEFTYPTSRGEAFRTFIQTAIARSQAFLLKQKKLLAVGVPYTELESACKSFGVKLYAIDSNGNAAWSTTGNDVIMGEDNRISCQTARIVSSLLDQRVHIDGCLTVCKSDYELLLTEQVCNHLGLNKAGVEAMELCLERSGEGLNEVLKKSNNLITHLSVVATYARTSTDDSNLGHSVHGNGYSKHTVYVVIYRRKLCAAFVFDTVTSLNEITSCVAYPSYLPWDKRRQVEIAAYQCCNEIGLVSGVFTVEMTMTSTGPKLLHIIPSLFDAHVPTWIKAVYGVDVCLAMLLIACDIEPKYFGPFGLFDEPHVRIASVMATRGDYDRMLADPSNAKLLQVLAGGDVIKVVYDVMGREMHRSNSVLPDETPHCLIYIIDSDKELILRKLSGVVSLIGLHTSNGVKHASLLGRFLDNT